MHSLVGASAGEAEGDAAGETEADSEEGEAEGGAEGETEGDSEEGEADGGIEGEAEGELVTLPEAETTEGETVGASEGAALKHFSEVPVPEESMPAQSATLEHVISSALLDQVEPCLHAAVFDDPESVYS